jgi:hypothetical protein
MNTQWESRCGACDNAVPTNQTFKVLGKMVCNSCFLHLTADDKGDLTAPNLEAEVYGCRRCHTTWEIRKQISPDGRRFVHEKFQGGKRFAKGKKNPCQCGHEHYHKIGDVWR